MLLKTNRRPSAALAAFVAAFEGGASSDGKFRPYWDKDGGVWTQGYGRTGPTVGRHSPPVSKRTALRWLRSDLDAVYGAAVRRELRSMDLKVSQRQFDALVSIAYNVGPGILARGRSLGDALRVYASQHTAFPRARVANAFRLYDKAGGKRLAGLTRRRNAEARLWMGGRYDPS